MVEALAEAPGGAAVALVADPERDIELIESLPYHVAVVGRPDLQFRTVPLATDPGQTTCADLYAAVTFGAEEPAFRALPCLAELEFQTDVFAEEISLPDAAPPFLRDLLRPLHVYYALIRAR